MNSFQSAIIFFPFSYYNDKKIVVCLFIFVTCIHLLVVWNLLYMQKCWEAKQHFFAFWMSFKPRLFLLKNWVEQMYDCRSFSSDITLFQQSFLPEKVPNSFNHALYLASCRKSPFFFGVLACFLFLGLFFFFFFCGAI